MEWTCLCVPGFEEGIIRCEWIMNGRRDYPLWIQWMFENKGSSHLCQNIFCSSRIFFSPRTRPDDMWCGVVRCWYEQWCTWPKLIFKYPSSTPVPYKWENINQWSQTFKVWPLTFCSTGCNPLEGWPTPRLSPKYYIDVRSDRGNELWNCSNDHNLRMMLFFYLSWTVYDIFTFSYHRNTACYAVATTLIASVWKWFLFHYRS